ncbi:MAG: LptF/LptG family permease [Chlamydiales bacterium]|nr:LptF/LptG family permease [Chlamydiales bacterium]
MKIWERHLLSELIKMFFLFLASFYFLFILFDYSTHMREFSAGIDTTYVAEYYLCHLSKYMPVLIPLALMVATIKVLSSLNQHRELVALQVGGISTKKIARPFLLSAVCCIGLLYANFQYWLPDAIAQIKCFEETYFTKERRFDPMLSSVPLEDGSKLYYQRFFQSEMALFDVLWMQSPDELWRIKSLTLTPSGPEGYFVDHLKRENGAFKLVGSHKHLPFPQIRLETLSRSQFFTPFEARSFQELHSLLHSNVPFYVLKRNTIHTHWLHKWVLPLISLTLVLAIFPRCVKFSRKTSIFSTYAWALFGFIVFYAVMGSAVIVGESISPYYAILIPAFLPLMYFGGRFTWR